MSLKTALGIWLLMLAAAAGCAGVAARPEEPFAAGVAAVDITPPVGYRMSGYFYERLSTGVADPLRAKALVLRQGGERIALVFCDLIGVPATVSGPARRLASEKTGIPAANILVAATHTHTGPLYDGVLRQRFHDEAVSRHGRDPQEAVDYPAELISKIVQAVVQADAAARPARLAAGAAEQPGLAFNRRFHMKDGSVRFNPGPLNPDIVRPAGPVDTEVSIVLVRGADGGPPAAALVNFALHLDTTGGTLYSADYPYHMEQALRESLGRDLVLLFATGTCGDINHIDVTKKQRPKPDAIGRTLAETAAAAAPGLKPVAPPALAARSRTVRVPLQRCTPEQLVKACSDIFKVGTRQLPFLEEVEACKILALDAETIPLEVQVFRLGRDVAVVGLPGEVFVELGLAIKQASPFAVTLVVELSSENPAYVPTRKAFAEGSYETVNSIIAPGGGEKLVEAAVRLLKSLAM